MTFSPDGRHLVLSGGHPEAVQVWDVVTNRKVVVRKTEDHAPAVVAFSPDSRTVVTGSKDKTVKLWDISAIGRKEARKKP